MKNTPSEGSGKWFEYNFSVFDVEKFLSKNNLNVFSKYITHNKDGQEKNPQEINDIMNDIINPNFDAPRIHDANESKTYLVQSVRRYLKGPDIVDHIDDICSLELGSYIMYEDIEDIKDVINKHWLLKNYRWMRFSVAEACKHSDWKLDNKKADKKIAKLFYNARQQYKEEFISAKSEYDSEMNARENKSDANDMYVRYDTLETPDQTAKGIIYNKFLILLDPEKKYYKPDTEIFDIFCATFEGRKKSHEKRIQQDKQELASLSITIHEDQSNQQKQLEKKLFEPVQLKTKNLQENIDPKFQIVDDEGDVIGLTWEHTPWWITENPPRIHDPFW